MNYSYHPECRSELNPLSNFWEPPQSDYFAHGGQACPRLQQHLEKRDRLLTYRLQDIWKKRQKVINARQLLDDEPFIAASRQYLAVNTPLKDEAVLPTWTARSRCSHA